MVRGMIGVPYVLGPFVFTAGYKTVNTDKDLIALCKEFSTFTVGLGVDNVRVSKNFSIGVFADWYTFSVKESLINFAFNAEFYAQYYFYTLPNGMKLYAKNRTGYESIFALEKSEGTFYTSFALGVKINEKK